ncbi:IS4 family transposase [Parapusillimonas granuli]|uniref:IS4 family transposase n=1 Tax=Parapusillimonas granuli TaxID=380911 RepID=A0A853G6V4_9BURK|nr:IS4 family transposase [Parapusillimonas granuli]MBB5213935.1 hypothetical protein [Parapusillimonas granuli]NYT50356.1 IS4 family transposase [Parapusillimonas granuli]
MAIMKARTRTQARLADYLMLGNLTLACPLSRVREALDKHGRHSRRRRGLPHEVLVYYVICLCLYRETAYEEVLHIVIEGLRRVYGDQIRDVAVTKGAISSARVRVGADVFETLYRSQVQPVGPVRMAGCWYRGLRIMGLVACTLDMHNAPDNAAYFGYPDATPGTPAFPQLRFCALAECGTHILLGARLGPHGTSERALAGEVLEAATGEMIVIADCGFTDFALWRRAQANGARLLFRACDSHVFLAHESLPDDSYLSKIYESPEARLRDDGIVVRVIEYRLDTDGRTHRLMTNWLDAGEAPAEELIALYHRRLPIEVAIAEMKTLLSDGMVLRSKKAELVRQEFYALLIAHAVIRKLMTRTAEEAGRECKELSFTHTIHILRQLLPHKVTPPETQRGVSEFGG